MARYTGFIRSTLLTTTAKKAKRTKETLSRPFSPNATKKRLKLLGFKADGRMRAGKRRPSYLTGIGIPKPNTYTVNVVEQVEFKPRVFPINYRWVKKKS